MTENDKNPPPDPPPPNLTVPDPGEPFKGGHEPEAPCYPEPASDIKTGRE